MKKTLTVFFLLLLLFACSQKQEKLIGVWKFKSLLDTPDIYNSQKWFASDSLYFRKDMSFRIRLGSVDSGSWSYDKDSKKISLKSDIEGENDFTVVSLEHDSLILLIGEMTCVYERTKDFH